MKKVSKRIGLIAALVIVAAVSYAGVALQTAGVQEATKTGLGGLVTIMNANDVALAARADVAITNITGLAAYVTNATVSVVAATFQTNITTYLDATTNAVAVTNIIPLTFTGTMTLQKVTPAVQK